MREKLFIRVRKDGFIYPYNDIMAANPACEVVTEAEAYPEKAFEDAEPAPKQRGRKPKVALEPPPPQEPLENLVSEFLASEASRGLPT